jgi:hypothetical protein
MFVNFSNGIMLVHALEPNVKLQQSNSNDNSMGNIASFKKNLGVFHDIKLETPKK